MALDNLLGFGREARGRTATLGIRANQISKDRINAQIHFVPLTYIPIASRFSIGPCELAILGGKVYVTTNMSDEVLIMQESDGTILERIRITPGIHFLIGAEAREGKVYFADILGNSIGILDPETLNVKFIPMPGFKGPVATCSICHCFLNGQPTLYFTTYLSGEIGGLNLRTNGLTFFKIRAFIPGLRGLDEDSKMRLWTCMSWANKLAVLDPRTGRQAQVPLPRGIGVSSIKPVTIIRGPDDNMWITEASTNRVTVLSQEGEFVKRFQFRPFSRPSRLGVVGNEVWMTEIIGNKLARMKNDIVTEFALPNRLSAPEGMAIDGNKVWFTEWLGNRIGFINTRTEELVEFDVGRPQV